jgi:hypothetical protein
MSQDFKFDDLSPTQLFWLILLSCPWVIWIVGKANEVYALKQAELAKQSFFERMWNGTNPGGSWFLIAIIGGGIGLCIIFVIAHVAAAAQEHITDQIADAVENRRRQKKQEQFETQSQKESALSKSAQSKKELIMRLGSIDQFIRVLENESDTSRRTVALQAAHSEMTALAAKLASEQINREMVEVP